ncbi:MAG: hypothetical protein LBM27_04455 [Lactobacillaceae bacterium]|jgi:hypothetical protein|nr:hypothetical protein [Lactobacillaceae bacterium]
MNSRFIDVKKEINKELLGDVYLVMFEAVDGNEKYFHELVRQFGGGQWNFPDHVYSKEKVKLLIVHQIEQEEQIDVAILSDLTGYGKRWIRSLVKEFQLNRNK